MRNAVCLFVALFALTCSTMVLADGKASSSISNIETQALTPLDDVLKAVSKKTDHQFAVAPNVPAAVSLGQLAIRDLDYAQFLQVLAVNRLAAVTNESVTSIVTDNAIRQHPLPLVTADTADVPGAQWVTHVIDTQPINAASLVPMLRPLLPSSAHLAAASDKNHLLVVDRWSNIQRLKAIVEVLKANAVSN